MPDQPKIQQTTLERELGEILLSLSRDEAIVAYIEVVNKTLMPRVKQGIQNYLNGVSSIETVIEMNRPVSMPVRIDDVKEKIDPRDAKEFIKNDPSTQGGRYTSDKPVANLKALGL